MKNKIKKRKLGITLAFLITYSIFLFLLAMRIQLFLDTHDIVILKVTNKQLISPLPKKHAQAITVPQVIPVAHAEEAPVPTVALGSSNPTGQELKTLVLSYFPKEDQPSVDKLIQQESTWNPNAVNKSSGACGLFQSIHCDYDMSNIKEQASWGEAYIRARYTTGTKAWEHEVQYGWY